MRYHTAIGLPPTLRLPYGIFPVRPTRHAREEASKDGLRIPSVVNTEKAEVFEVVTNDKGLTERLGLRMVADESRDICLVVCVVNRVWTVVTVWANRHSDRHHNLDQSKYDRPV